MSNGKLSNYKHWSDEMRTGDLLLWRADKWYMRLWRRCCHSEWDHSSNVFRLREYKDPLSRDYHGLERRRFMLESRIHGTVLNLLSRRLEKYDGEVWWYPLIDKWNPHRQKIGETMLAWIGVPYNVSGVVKTTFRRWIGVKCTMVFQKIGRSVGRLLVQSVFCSEYSYIAYKSTGQLTKVFNTPPSPGDLLNLGIFKDGIRIF